MSTPEYKPEKLLQHNIIKAINSFVKASGNLAEAEGAIKEIEMPEESKIKIRETFKMIQNGIQNISIGIKGLSDEPIEHRTVTKNGKIRVHKVS